MKHFLVFALIIILAQPKLFAQGEIPVSMYTGTPQISVPIGSISSYDVNVPVYFSYDASGVRVAESSGIFGLGWQIVGGGTISREIRNLPDDQPSGWIYTSSNPTLASDVNNKIVAPTGTNACPVSNGNETAVQTAISSYYTSNADTEPDIFNFSIPGSSGQFIFGNSTTPTIHLIPWQDISVTFTQNSSQAITAFVITTDDGVKYTFDQTSTEIRTTASLGTTPSVEVKQRDYLSYLNSTVKYSTEWKLTKIVSPIGGTVTFTYFPLASNSMDTIRMSVRNAYPSTTYTTIPVYTDSRSDSQLQLSSITGLNGNAVSFTPVAAYPTRITFYDYRRNSAQYKTFTLSYFTTTWGYPRTYLKTITEGTGCDQKPPYIFNYFDGEDSGIALPAPWSKAIDFWGYANGIATNADKVPTLYVYPQLPVQERIRILPLTSYGGTSYTIPGANRLPSTVGVLAGTLNWIQYPSGGSTTIIYEPNQYFDAQAGQNAIGGGIRINSFTYFDGINPQATITKTFKYTDSTGYSSGHLINRPLFAEPVMQYIDPITGSPGTPPAGDWTYELIRTEEDLSAGETTFGSAVGYKEVTVSRVGNPGSGSARYQYLVPGTYGDVTIGAWSPSLDGFARSNNPCPAMLDVITAPSAWQFPYARNTSFDYERGLAWQLREYDANNILVRRTKSYYQYVYTIGSTPTNIYGLKFEKFPNGPAATPTFLYSKYNLLADVSKVIYKELVTTYDANNSTVLSPSTYDAAIPTIFTLKTTEYDRSPTHHLLTQVKTTMPDGTLYSNQMRYPLDYTVGSGSDVASQMILNLQSNFRNGTPVEQFAYVKRPGDVKKYTGGSLIMYGNFGLTSPLPQYAYKLNLSTPLTSFDSSYVTSGTSAVFHKNLNYDLVQSFTAFDSYGNPLTSVGQNQIPVTTAYGFSGTAPVVSVQNASFGQFAFSDFETSTGSEFGVTPTTASSGTGRTGSNALYAAGTTFTKTIQKTTSNYKFSLWLSGASTTFTIQVPNTAQPVTVTWTPTGSGFQYFETTVPVSAAPSSFMVSISCASSGSPLIDDVGFFPAGSIQTTSTYTFPFGQNSVTTNGNQTKYTVFDGLGRQKYVMDTYQNIREKDAYNYPTSEVPTLVSFFNYPTMFMAPGNYPPPFGLINNPGLTYVYDGPNTFTANPNICIDGGVIYTWQVSYNSGSVIVSTVVGSATQQLILPAIAGVSIYTVTLTVSHPVYGSSTYSASMHEILQPANVSSCATGAWVVCTTDNVEGVVSSYYVASQCPSIPNVTGLFTNYGVTSVTGLGTGETVTSYQWQIQPANATTFTNIGTNSSQFLNYKTNVNTTGNIYVQCLITTSVGRVGICSPMVVQVVYSTTPCTGIN